MVFVVGVCPGKRPWCNGGVEGTWAMEHLIKFMINVLIPLAESTNALIFVDVTNQPCMLTYACSS